MSEDAVTCDVLVAGSGAAGFAAALTAHLEGLNVIMVEKEPLFGGTTAYSAGVVWVPANSQQRAAGITDSPAAALEYLAHHVGNRLERAKAEAFIDNAPAMLDCFAREGFASFTLAPTWADYHPDEPGASQGGRSLGPETFDGRRLGSWFAKLRPPIKTMMAFGGMMIGRSDPAADLSNVTLLTGCQPCRFHGGALRARSLEACARHAARQWQRTRRTHGRRGICPRRIPLWLSSPIVELRREGTRITGANGREAGAEAREGSATDD